FDDAGAALAAAEQALRDARQLPVGIAAHQPPEAAEAEADADRVVMLHEALMNDRFELAYQPIVAVAGGEEAQYQTLLRLRDADGNMHTAAQILPVAEAVGVLHEIERHGLEIAVAILDHRVGD